MIERRHEGGGRRSRALFSDCGAYRYLLERDWAPGPRLLWVLLNPSTADEARNDPTIERCERRARALGYGGLAVANLFAFRVTRPADLKRAADPVGAQTDRILRRAARSAGAVLCGWGTHGALLGRGAAVEALLRREGLALLALGLTRQGHPRHPLYVAYDVAPMPWAGAENTDN
ncbi:MAG: DUF1643 domain-containing protein [Rhodobacteraceae bacterium]|nr:DUF1643 domain-containing protein [Paracoccaceae bacterium]